MLKDAIWAAGECGNDLRSICIHTMALVSGQSRDDELLFNGMLYWGDRKMYRKTYDA